MLTRSQVARRLGKSIATVRRMEGSDLHPRRDDRGVHWFEPDEVDAVASRGKMATAPTMRDDPADEWCHWLENERADRADGRGRESGGHDGEREDPAPLTPEVRPLRRHWRRGADSERRYAELAEIRRCQLEQHYRLHFLGAEIIGRMNGLSQRQLRRFAQDDSFVELLTELAGG